MLAPLHLRASDDLARSLATLAYPAGGIVQSATKTRVFPRPNDLPAIYVEVDGPNDRDAEAATVRLKIWAMANRREDVESLASWVAPGTEDGRILDEWRSRLGHPDWSGSSVQVDEISCERADPIVESG